MRLADHRFPARAIFGGQAQRREILDQHFGVEDAQHQLFAEGGGQYRSTQFDLATVRTARLHAPVLRLALFGHVESRQDLQARDDRDHDGTGHLVDLVQLAVDSKTHIAKLAPRLDVNVAGALFESVVEQPVHDIDDVLVVGIEFAGAPQFGELFEILDATRRHPSAFHGAGLDRARQRVEFDQVALNLLGVGQQALDALARDTAEFFGPLVDKGFAGGDAHLLRCDLDRQDAQARRVGVGHDGGDLGHVDRQRVDALVAQPGASGQPLRQRLGRQHALQRCPRIGPALLCDQ